MEKYNHIKSQFKLKLPYTPLLLSWGILIGARSETMHIFGDSVSIVNNINPVFFFILINFR